MLFNELYPLADLGSFWGRPIGSSPQAPPVYSFMECYDYPYYETLDVRFYGSMPLLKFWPEPEWLDFQIQVIFSPASCGTVAANSRMTFFSSSGQNFRRGMEP